MRTFFDSARCDARVMGSALALAALLAGCKRAAEPAATSAAVAELPVVTVRVAPVGLSSESPPIRAVGTLARQTEADLSFPVGGVLERVTVRAGDRVKQGQELARLQPDQIEAQFIQASAAVEKAKRDLARIEKLQGERVMTLENLQDARTQVEQASAALRSADFNRRHAVIKAPADGVILRRTGEPNELVGAGRPVLGFAAEKDGWIARAGLTARDMGRVAVGAAAEARTADGAAVNGKVVRIAETADPATRTVQVEVQLATAPADARSGGIVTLSITARPVAERVHVPVGSLQDGLGGRAAIFLVDATRKAKRVPVEVEQVDGERAYLRTALPAGAQVIVVGAQYVRDGATVNVAEDTRSAAK